LSEQVELLGPVPDDAGHALVPELVAGCAEPGGGAVEEGDRAGVARRAYVLPEDADREVGGGAFAEVGGGERGAEEVDRLGGIGDAARVLGQN
jgi:hypothetical protein